MAVAVRRMYLPFSSFSVSSYTRFVPVGSKSAACERERDGVNMSSSSHLDMNNIPLLNIAFEEDTLMMIMIKQYLLFLSRCEHLRRECMHEPTTSDDSTSLLDYKFDQFIFYPILTDSNQKKNAFRAWFLEKCLLCWPFSRLCAHTSNLVTFLSPPQE